MKKRIVSLLLALCMITAMGSAFAQSDSIPDYINLDSYIPLLNEDNDVKLDIGIVVDSDYSQNPMDRYYWNLMTKTMNIDCEVSQVTNKDEYVTLTFAANDLPDLMVGVDLNPTQLVNYGILEGQLLDLTPYMENAELMPRINELFALYPEVKAGITLPNGAIYAFPYITDPNLPTIFSGRSINTTMLESIHKEMPATLDELIDVLYAFKELNPEIIPLAGGHEYANPGVIILTALGFETKGEVDPPEQSICLRSGKVELVGADEEAFTEYLTLMNQFYNDGILDPDYYTVDNVSLASDMANGLLGVFGTTPDGLTADPALAHQYTSLVGLTSDYSAIPIVAKNNYFQAGSCVVSADTDYAEAICRWADWMLTNEGTHADWPGSAASNTALKLDGWGGWYLNENYSRRDVDRDTYPDKWDGAVSYLKQCVGGFNMGSLGFVIGEDAYRQTMSGLPIRDPKDVWASSPENVPYYWRTAAVEAFEDIAVVDIAMLMFYFDEETNDRIIELESVILNHIESESAKFITGVRSLDEVDAYYEELKSLGVDEYVQYYQDAYTSYASNLAG